jgi:hypothetical protein
MSKNVTISMKLSAALGTSSAQLWKRLAREDPRMKVR